MPENFLGHEKNANDVLSSAALIGPPGAAVKLFNAYHFDKASAGGWFTMACGSDWAVLVPNLNDVFGSFGPPSASVTPGRDPPSGQFNDGLSSASFA